MKLDSDTLRKAAILAASLDADTADKLLDQLPAEQAEVLRRAIVSLGEIDPRDERAAIDDFLRAGSPGPRDDIAGMELNDQLQRQLQTPRPTAQDAPLASGSLPFRFLHEAAEGRLMPLLKEEHPQTIALVMAHLPPARTLSLLTGLSPRVQADVVRRLVELDEAHPDILREVERGLASRISAQAQLDDRRQARLSVVAGILRAADPLTERAILANLERHDPQLASRLRRPLPVLMDLRDLDDADLAVVFTSVDQDLAVLALAGAELELAERVLPRLDVRREKALRHALDHLGPTRLTDVAAAEQELLHAARRLAAEGRIHLPAVSGDTLVLSAQAA